MAIRIDVLSRCGAQAPMQKPDGQSKLLHNGRLCYIIIPSLGKHLTKALTDASGSSHCRTFSQLRS